MRIDNHHRTFFPPNNAFRRAADLAHRSFSNLFVQTEILADRQAIQWMLADGRTELSMASLLADKAAWLKDQGKPYGAEAAMAKLGCTEMAWRLADRAVQIHGGYGYSKDYDVERYYRDVRVLRIYEGTSEIQKIVIARDLLAEYGA